MSVSKSIEEVLSEIDEALSEDANHVCVAKQKTGIAAVATQHDISPSMSQAHHIRPQPHIFVPDPTPLSELPRYFTKTQLLKNRKWTQAEIRNFLGDPDVLKATRNYRTCKLYQTERVLAVEHRPIWRNIVDRPSQVQLSPFDRDVRFGFYRVRDLFDRGWHQEDIKMFLGEPHRYGRNRDGWRVKLYKVVTVENIEATEGWFYRRSAVAPILYQQGLPLSRIRDILSLSWSQVYTFTRKIREAIREGRIEREALKSQRKKPTQRELESKAKRERKAKERQMAIRLHDAGVSKHQIAKRLGRSRTTISRWLAAESG